MAQEIEDHFEDNLDEIIQGKANKTHYGIDGTMPENLPGADNVKKIEKKLQTKQLKNKKEKPYEE